MSIVTREIRSAGYRTKTVLKTQIDYRSWEDQCQCRIYPANLLPLVSSDSTILDPPLPVSTLVTTLAYLLSNAFSISWFKRHRRMLILDQMQNICLTCWGPVQLVKALIYTEPLPLIFEILSPHVIRFTLRRRCECSPISALRSRIFSSQSSKGSSKGSSTSRGSGYYSYNSSQEEVTPVKKPKSNTYKGPLEEGTLDNRPPFEQVKVLGLYLRTWAFYF